MEKNKKKVDFDLSKNTLPELIELYKKIDDFIKFLDSKKIDADKKVEK